MRILHDLAPLTAVALAISACSDESISPGFRPGIDGGRVATVEWEGSTPMLYLQDADGSGRVRVHFENVTDDIPGNLDLPVTDETILAIPRMKWSPDGQYLAVIVAPAYEALQVVLVRADGRALRTVSPNSQYIWSDVEWSSDSRRIAYVMATTQNGGLPDLFVTDLSADSVIRVTTIGTFTGYDTFRFDPSGGRLYFVRRVGWAEDGINGRSRVGYIDLGSGSVVEGKEVIGDPQGLTRDGSWGLFTRWSVTHPDQSDLIRVPLRLGTERVLTTGDLGHAIDLGVGRAPPDDAMTPLAHLDLGRALLGIARGRGGLRPSWHGYQEKRQCGRGRRGEQRESSHGFRGCVQSERDVGNRQMPPR